mmetsp:Transcript_13394/g.35602  ORF Transcript_13394/g.35602 Transcript_13394/m.35602 type:complete len:313 (+) Transcript_13394:266-1204(+)
MRRVLVIVVVAHLSSAWVPAAPSRPTPRRATENENDEDSSPLAWLRSKRDTFEPKWSWLKDRRDFSDVVRAGRRAERDQLVRGQRAIKESISRLAAPGAAGELLDFLEGEVRKERAVRNATLIFIKDEWAREEALRRETRAREEALRESALRFVDDEWAREDELRRDARAFVADEFERLADADEELAARIRGAPQITVCAAPIACGKADGQLVHDRLARLAAGEALAGRPAPLVRCATKCASNCRAGKVAVTLGAPRREVVYCDASAAAACEDALGYCDPAAVEAARDEDVDRQLEAILERGRRSTRQKKRR